LVEKVVPKVPSFPARVPFGDENGFLEGLLRLASSVSRRDVNEFRLTNRRWYQEEVVEKRRRKIVEVRKRTGICILAVGDQPAIQVRNELVLVDISLALLR
jgi:hypothetical protein